MSHPHEGTGHPRAEDDHVESRTVALVGVGALVAFTVASLAAMAYLRLEVARRPAATLPPELGQTKIGLVEQSLFSDGNPLRGDRDRAARLVRLHGWGWVDRPGGVAHIPIEEAMELVVQGARAPRADPPVAPPLGAAHGGVDAPSVPIAPEGPAAGRALPPPARPRAAAGGLR